MYEVIFDPDERNKNWKGKRLSLVSGYVVPVEV